MAFQQHTLGYDHHVVAADLFLNDVPLSSAYRGARGFANFANECRNLTSQVPIYIYDRLVNRHAGCWKMRWHSEGGEICRVFATVWRRLLRLGVTVKAW